MVETEVIETSTVSLQGRLASLGTCVPIGSERRGRTSKTPGSEPGDFTSLSISEWQLRFVVSHIGREDHINACESDGQPRDGHQDHLEAAFRDEECAVRPEDNADPEQVGGDV
jgi:hypothetical protein